MIVFLDFDGVLHPEFDPDDPERPKQNSDLFCRLPLIEAVLREFSQVEIVISSAWRMYFLDSEDGRAHAGRPMDTRSHARFV